MFCASAELRPAHRSGYRAPTLWLLILEPGVLSFLWVSAKAGKYICSSLCIRMLQNPVAEWVRIKMTWIAVQWGLGWSGVCWGCVSVSVGAGKKSEGWGGGNHTRRKPYERGRETKEGRRHTMYVFVVSVLLAMTVCGNADFLNTLHICIMFSLCLWIPVAGKDFCLCDFLRAQPLHHAGWWTSGLSPSVCS